MHDSALARIKGDGGLNILRFLEKFADQTNPTRSMTSAVTFSGRKKVPSRFKAFVQDPESTIRKRTKLLKGNTFEEQVDDYDALVQHVKGIWVKSKDLYTSGDFALSAFFSLLAIEETGKLYLLWQDFMREDNGGANNLSGFFTNHKRKAYIGIMSACLINSRLDRLLGTDCVVKMIELAERNNGLMKLRNKAFYIDHQEGKLTLPKQVIDQDLSMKLCVLSGEIMAESLGFFTWHFFDLIREVNTFENEIGLHNETI